MWIGGVVVVCLALLLLLPEWILTSGFRPW